MKIITAFIAILGIITVQAQRQPDYIYMKNVATPQLYQQGNQESMPVIRLGSPDLLELHFDDMDADIKNYYYTFELCNADWQPTDLSSFDYIKGFQQVQLNDYTVSSLALTKYVHYQTIIPDKNCMPVKSGNYLLKVYLDGDTSRVAFTKRMYVLDSKIGIGASVQQPFDNQMVHSHHKIQISLNTNTLNVFSPQQQVKMVVLQNNRWDNIITGKQPAFIRENVLEYDGEQDFLFPAGKEYRWADVRSFRYQSDRIASVNRNVVPNDVYLKPEGERVNQRYLYYRDDNGAFYISTTESINPISQGEYGWIHFTFIPAGNQPYAGKEVHLLGAITGNQISDSSLMQYNAAKGVYEKTMFLKQGYYSYIYVTKDSDNQSGALADATLTDGNSWETENNYTVLVYYRSFNDRADELVGIKTVGSRTGRIGN